MTAEPQPGSGAIFSPVPRGAFLDRVDQGASDGMFLQPRFSVARVDRMISSAIGLIALIFGAQSLWFVISNGIGIPGAIGQWYLSILMASLAAVIVTAPMPRAQRTANIVFAVVYFVAVALWPTITGGAGALSATGPWTWYVNSIAAACVAQAARPAIAAVYSVMVAAVYGFGRVLDPSGAVADLSTALLDMSYAAIVSLIILALVANFRVAARRVDEARSAAFARYGEAARQHAREVERIEVDAFVHDTALAALQAADRATTPEQSKLAANLAGDAINRLALLDDVADSTTMLELGNVVDGIRRYADSLRRPFHISLDGPADHHIGYSVGEGLYFAIAQAMSNSVQHADGGETRAVTRSVSVVVTKPDSIRIVVSDDGVGFDRARIDSDRLGLRVSIIERVVAVGGSVEFESACGRGTRVIIGWAPSQDTGSFSPSQIRRQRGGES